MADYRVGNRVLISVKLTEELSTGWYFLSRWAGGVITPDEIVAHARLNQPPEIDNPAPGVEPTGLRLKELGEAIAARRGAHGVRAAAREAGVSHATLSRTENGHMPSLDTFAAICRWLNEDPSKFLGLVPMYRPSDDWQPIETAPHGVEVLLATPPFASMGTAARLELRVGMASWGERIGNISNISTDGWATHWRPLPPAPETEGGR